MVKFAAECTAGASPRGAGEAWAELVSPDWAWKELGGW